MPSPGCRVRSVAVLATVTALACALAPIAAADPPHGEHFGGGRGHFAAHPPAGARGGAQWRGSQAAGGRWHAGLAPPRQGWDRGRWQAGDWDGDHWRGGDWDDRYGFGGVWAGGDWDGLYWPPADYDWDYPWYLPAVPYGAVTIWFGNIPYYYVNRIYYLWSPYYGGYVVADPPPVAARTPGTPGAGPQSAQGESARGVLSLRVIPRKGQSEQQTANDRYACHQWAVAQTGFDPINPAQDAHASSAVRASYRRALIACLSARGYSVQMPSR